MNQDAIIAQQLLDGYLPWSEQKWAADQKWLKSILDAWGFQ